MTPKKAKHLIELWEMAVRWETYTDPRECAKELREYVDKRGGRPRGAPR